MAAKKRRLDNPFEQEVRDVVSANDVELFRTACNTAVTMKNNDQKVWELISGIPVRELEVFVATFSTSKQQNDLKVRSLIEKIPALTSMMACETKLKGSYQEIVTKLSSNVWADICQKSTNGKFSADFMKNAVSKIIKDLGAMQG